MKQFYIECHWTMTGQYIIEAKNEEEAKQKVLLLPLPSGDYLGDTFEIDEIIDPHLTRD